MCKSNFYLAHRIVVFGSESKKEMMWHVETRVLQDLYKPNTTFSNGRDPCLSPVWEEAQAEYKNHWHSKKQGKETCFKYRFLHRVHCIGAVYRSMCGQALRFWSQVTS